MLDTKLIEKYEYIINQLKEENKKLKEQIKYGLVWEEEKEEEDSNFSIKEIKDKRIITDINKKDNIIMEGENLNSLKYLLNEYREKIDAIYIDPPYNTNKKFKYNDKYKDGNNNYKHSKWISFMNKRLKLAQQLLKKDGVIFISIDEYEFAQLKLLCDRIFEENNYIGNIIWDKCNPKGGVKTITSRTEYILVYAKEKSSIKSMMVKKENAESIINKAAKIFNKNLTLEEKNKEFREWLRKQNFMPGEMMYNKIDEKGDVYREISLCDQSRYGQKYEVKHPLTKKECKKPRGGWSLSKRTMEDFIDKGIIIFGKDETTIPLRKYLLKENMYSSMTDLIAYQGGGAKDLVEMGFDKFDFDKPKPIYIIKKILQYTDKNAIILDFFAGSGTTGQAVLTLNKEDNGDRRFILCNNNENNICEEITYIRCKKAIEGYINNKNRKINGLGGNLIYLKIEKQ